MTENQPTATRRQVGLAGVIASLFILVQVPLYFIYSGAPPDWDILTRGLIGVTGCTVFVVFFTGLRQLVLDEHPRFAWVAGLLQASGLLWVAMVFVPQSMEVGAAIVTKRDIDTTTDGPYAAAQYLMQGGISRLLMALFMVALAVVVGRTGLLRPWVARSAWVLAVVNLAFLPAVFFGDDAAHFYSAQGWGTTATMGAVWSIWVLAVSIALVRSTPRRTDAAVPTVDRERERVLA